MFCTKCGASLPPEAANCPTCGAAVASGAAKQAYVQGGTPPGKGFTHGDPGNPIVDFLLFRIMITPIILTWIYVILAVISFFGVIIALTAELGVLGFFLSIPATLIVQVGIRVFFENVILFFKIKDELAEIRKTVKH